VGLAVQAEGKGTLEGKKRTVRKSIEEIITKRRQIYTELIKLFELSVPPPSDFGTLTCSRTGLAALGAVAAHTEVAAQAVRADTRLPEEADLAAVVAALLTLYPAETGHLGGVCCTAIVN
jgi:hypothetical protein